MFEVSSWKILTPKDFQRETKINFAEHKRINLPSLLEYTGRGLEEIKFSVTFHRGLGIDDVLMAVHEFREMAWEGAAEFLVIGEHLYTENRMVIENLSESVEYWTADGKHLVSEMKVEFKEYLEE